MFTAIAFEDTTLECRTHLFSHVLPKALHKSFIPALVEEKIPFQRLFDLAITYYYPSMDDASVFLDVTNDLIRALNVSLSDIACAASENMWSHYDLTPLPDVINMLDSHSSFYAMGTELYVATNLTRTNGSGVIASKETLQVFADRLGSFYILPTSIHECILVPCFSGADAASLYRMVCEINAAYTPLEEQLSDNVYIVGSDGKIESYL